MTITPDQLVSSLRWRYATKRFDAARRIPAEIWESLEESLVLTPSSFGLQPWQFLIIENPATRANLLGESWGQSQVVDASHFVVFTVRTDLQPADIEVWMERVLEVQNTTAETVAGLKGVIQGFAEGLSHEARHAWNIRQAYIALGQLMTTAALLEIDACPMEGLSTAGYDQILGLAGSGYSTVMACALGYRAADDRFSSLPKVRFERSKVIRHV